MKARVVVTLKSGVLDPQGKAIEGALRSLSIDGVAAVRQGKVFDIELVGEDRDHARNLRHFFTRGEVTRQELQSLHGVVSELVRGRKEKR